MVRRVLDGRPWRHRVLGTRAEPRSLDPHLFGSNAALAPMTNLGHDAPALLAAGCAMGLGSSQTCVGTMSNFWSLAVLVNAFARLTSFARYDCARPGTFTPERYWNGESSISQGPYQESHLGAE